MVEVCIGNRCARLGLTVWVVVALAGLLFPAQVGAQDGKQGDSPTWDDAPIVPRYRSVADWLVDVGWKTSDEMFGPFVTHEYQVGETEQFFPLGSRDSRPQTFTLEYRTEHAYFWVEQGAHFEPAELEAAARFFEDRIWPLNHRIYGDEWKPGIDGDNRLHIVNQAHIDAGIVGAFNPDDQCPRALCPESNQREIIYVNLNMAPLNSQEYLATLAHEHQHLIQHFVDGNEQRWLNEGLSQLSEHLNGFHPRYVGGRNLNDFLSEPDHSLHSWSFDGANIGQSYGASYLFLVYLYERFGLEFIQELAGTSYDGLGAVQHTLTETQQGISVDAVFSDWILANYLDDPYVERGQYYYQSLDLPLRIQPEELRVPDTGLRFNGTVSQYGADYLSLGPGTYDLSFDGGDRAVVIGAAPYSADWMWWSYNGLSSASRLTGAFDLTGLDRATLVFNAWWNVEEDYDWLQVLVSANGGQDWQIVNGAGAATSGPKAPGAYYSGRSEQWVNEVIDLSAYAGGPVLIRFEYLTDGSETKAGVALDDIGIEELGYVDDVESLRSVWNPEGFMRIPDGLTQNWTVTLVYEGVSEHAAVQPLALDPMHTARATVTVPEGGTATLVIGAMAPFTSNRANYKLTIQHCP